MPNFTAPPKNPMDNPKLGIQGDKWSDDNFARPKMTLRVVNNAIWISAYLNHPDEPEGAEPINIKMDPVIANTFLALLQDAIDNPKDFAMAGVENKNFIYPMGKRSEKPMDLGTAFVSVNGSGEICIVLTYPGRKVSMYPLQSTFWSKLVNKDGSPMDRSRASRMVAQGWLNTMKQLIGPILFSTYKHPEPKPRADNSNYKPPATGGDTKPPPSATETGTDIFSDMN